MSADSDAPEDCRACGACCVSESPHHVRVTGDDYERLGDDADEWVIFEENRAFFRIAELAPGIRACAALRVANGTFECAIYARRPNVCRELERGSPVCAGERERKGVRALRIVR
jgi:Fe-S-cluster containining protein